MRTVVTPAAEGKHTFIPGAGRTNRSHQEHSRQPVGRGTGPLQVTLLCPPPNKARELCKCRRAEQQARTPHIHKCHTHTALMYIRTLPARDPKSKQLKKKKKDAHAFQTLCNPVLRPQKSALLPASALHLTVYLECIVCVLYTTTLQNLHVLPVEFSRDTVPLTTHE